MFSAEFETLRTLRLYAAKGGKIAFVGQKPLSTAGFKDFIPKSIRVDITMRHIEKNDPNQVLFIPDPNKDKDNLLTWTAEHDESNEGFADRRNFFTE